jgi:competence protein ComEA
MFATRRDRVDDEVRERFVRVVGLPELDDDDPDPVSPSSSPPESSLPGAPTAMSVPSAPAAGGLRGVLGAFDPGRRGVRALAVVAVAAVAVAAFFAWRARPQAEAVAAVPDPPPAAVVPPSASSGVVVVAVSGRVRTPGLVRLPAGARVADAIEAAGGALPDTDLSLVNLARKVVDGELVAVGIAVPPGGGPAVAGPGTPGGQLNLNSATAAQFEALPGIGPVLAQHMVDYRTRHGQYRTVEELRQVDGLGAARFNQIKDLVTV